MAVVSMKQLLEAGVHFDTKQKMEPKNGTLHLYRKKRNLHHRLTKQLKIR